MARCVNPLSLFRCGELHLLCCTLFLCACWCVFTLSTQLFKGVGCQQTKQNSTSYFCVLQVHASDSKASLSTDSETKIKAKPRIERNRVLVTGGAGFVGSHLCTYLVERGDHVSCPAFLLDFAVPVRRSSTAFSHVPTLVLASGQVICVDNFFTGSKENIAHLIGKTNFELIRHDVVEKILLEVDQIFHLACPASPIHYK